MEQQNEIAKIAYEIYLMRNGAPGDPISDWLTAERIFAERQAKSVTLRTLAEPVMTAEEPSVTVVETSVSPVFLAPKTRKKAAPKVEAEPKVAEPKKTAAKAKATPAPKAEVEAAKPAKPRASRKKTATE